VKRSFSNGEPADAELFKINANMATNRLLETAGSTDRFRTITSAAPFGAGHIRYSDHEGTTVCAVGSQQYYRRCGWLKNKRVKNTPCTAGRDCAELVDQKRASFESFEGDSGGPLYRKNAAWGVVSSTPFDKTKPTTFSAISRILDRFKVTLVGAD
jgi:hypothetical protein